MDSDGREVFSRIPPSTQPARSNETAQQNHLTFRTAFWCEVVSGQSSPMQLFSATRPQPFFPSVQVYRSLTFSSKRPPEIFVSRPMQLIDLRRPSFQLAYKPTLMTLHGVKSSLVDHKIFIKAFNKLS